MNAKTIVLTALTCAVLPVPSAMAHEFARAAEASTDVIAGTWKSDFGPDVWLFRFSRESGSWSGQYMSTKYNKWHDLVDLTVQNGDVSFSIKSSPTVTFRMALSKDGNGLNGSASLPNGKTFSQSAVRVS